MKQFSLILAMMLVFTGSLLAQTTVTGTVTDDAGEPLISANVVVKGTTVGTVTDFDGKYSIEVPEGSTALVFTYTGYDTKEVAISGSVVDATMSEGVALDEVVVTALGIERESRSLGYATTELGGDETTKAKDANFINSLSGKVAGLDVKRSSTLGGSSNVIIRGYTSLTGNNQALFVVDGTPISNSNTNSSNMATGRGGYDYGNAAMDINPEDIESISVLKGAAATALYGSLAANGVILITTKKGSKKKGLGVTINTGVSVGMIDESTAPVYQKEFGAGYGAFYDSDDGYFEEGDFFGTGTVTQAVPMGEDASYGGAFDGRQVITWENIYPELPGYGGTSSFSAGTNDANSFYQTAATYNNSISIDGGTDVANFRLSYTNFQQEGIVPNSEINKNTVSFASGLKLNDKLRADAQVNYIFTEGQGRYGTGYDSRNVNQSFRQWYNVGTDMESQREAYESTGKNLSWNPYGINAANPTAPHYFDNYYWTANENYQTDNRSRTFGNLSLTYSATDWLDIVGRVSIDRYDEIQEERIAVGSVDVSEYSRFNRSFSMRNYDLIASFKKYFGANDIFDVNGNVGMNIRRTEVNSVFSATNGGLVVPGVYALSNSVSTPLAPSEGASKIGVDGYFGQVSIGYKRMLYLDLSGRQDYFSTLPADNNSDFYPAASMSFVFSELLENEDILSFGKFRVNYAEVSNGAGFSRIDDVFLLGTPFDGNATASVPSSKNNSNLVPERTKSIEAGLELKFMQNRFGLDISVYESSTFDQLLPVTTSLATGYSSTFINIGEVSNEGIELQLNANVIRMKDFNWDIGLNWARNTNEVVSLFGDQTNLQLASVQGGISLNATVGEAYGAIWGTNYVKTADGNNSLVDHFYQAAYGIRGGVMYEKTSTPEVIGNINPDWKGGVRNTFSYKDVSLSFLIDIQKGGDFFSLDTWYGYGTGVYDITAGTNINGESVRANPDVGGGLQLDGEYTGTSSEDWATNRMAYMGNYANSLAWNFAPNAYHVYDASFAKLRELTLTYSVPKSVFSNLPISSLDVSFVGRNLWIISKNSPYSDPEAGLSAGNVQGYQSGSYPAVKEYGVNLRVKF